MPVAIDPLLKGLVRDESLTRGLDDIEARMLVDWVADWTELLVAASRTEREAKELARRIFRRAQAIGRFVQLWRQPSQRCSAVQLAAVERFCWPLPTEPVEAPELMAGILEWENRHPSH